MRKEREKVLLVKRTAGKQNRVPGGTTNFALHMAMTMPIFSENKDSRKVILITGGNKIAQLRGVESDERLKEDC
jgi:hypothetical protein